jgi:7-cyano-7-deazaguanine synthase in queuosine biosynthesis
MAFSFFLRAPGEKRRPPRTADAVVHLDEPGLYGYPIHHNLEQFFASPHLPAGTVTDFLLTSLAIWAADKLVLRRHSPDAWTRDITLSLPAASSWAAGLPRLAALLNFLTGDNWVLNAREGSVTLGHASPWPHAWLPQAVVLFSGGLDSLVGAIDNLEAGRQLLLVSHYDFGQLAAVQQALAAGLHEHYGPGRLHHLGIRVQFPEAPELTLRSRSLLYLALGLTAAAAFGPDTPLLVPENGWISLNPPLTLNRLGPYSTRTTHPYFLARLTALWQEADISHPLANPYQDFSKGEMLAHCRNRGLLERLFTLTISCARPEVGRWQGQGTGACGYCYPCLMRRAALDRLGWDNGRDYRVDVLSEPEIVRHRVKGSDLRALLIALKTWENAPQEMESRLWLSGQAAGYLSETRPLLEAGFQELDDFLRNRLGSRLDPYLT